MSRELQRAFLAMLPLFIAALRTRPPSFPPPLLVVQGDVPGIGREDVAALLSGFSPTSSRACREAGVPCPWGESRPRPAPLRPGAASLVIYRDGSSTVAKWGRDAKLSSNVVAVRQNLDLLVDNGKAVAGLSANDTGSSVAASTIALPRRTLATAPLPSAVDAARKEWNGEA